MDWFFQIVMGFLGVAAVLVLAYVVTKIYAGKFGASLGYSKNIKVIDKLPTGKGGSIAIIELSGKQYVVGITEHSINLIKELDELIQPTDSQTNLAKLSETGFMKALKKSVRKEEEKDGID